MADDDRRNGAPGRRETDSELGVQITYLRDQVIDLTEVVEENKVAIEEGRRTVASLRDRLIDDSSTQTRRWTAIGDRMMASEDKLERLEPLAEAGDLFRDLSAMHALWKRRGRAIKRFVLLLAAGALAAWAWATEQWEALKALLGGPPPPPNI